MPASTAPTAATYWVELSESQQRQYIDAESVHRALQDALRDAAEVRGSMLWREVKGTSYLVRTNLDNSQKSLGAQSKATRAVFDKFMARKAALQERVTRLKASAELATRLNRAQRVGRTPAVVVKLLQVLAKAGLEKHFLVVGTHALYAYESACGVRFLDDATATQDVDLLMNTQKHMSLVSTLDRDHGSLLALLQKADKSFELRDDQLQTAVNADGFEVDVIRRYAKGDDPHPLKTSSAERDFWAVQVGSGEQMMSSPRYAQMVVGVSGQMATMHTIAPQAFVRLKRKLAASKSREAIKKSKDALQARAVAALVKELMPLHA